MKKLLLVLAVVGLIGCSTFQKSEYRSVSNHGSTEIYATGTAANNAAFGGNTYSSYGNYGGGGGGSKQPNKPQKNQYVNNLLQGTGSAISSGVNNLINRTISNAF